MPAKFGGTLNRPQGQQLHPEAQSRIPERVPGADDSGAPRAFSDLEGDVTGDPGENTVEKIWNIPVAVPAAGDDAQFLRFNFGAQTLTFETPVPDPVQGSYAPGSFTVPTGKYALMSKQLQLTTTQRVTLQGTARLRIT